MERREKKFVRHRVIFHLQASKGSIKFSGKYKNTIYYLLYLIDSEFCSKDHFYQETPMQESTMNAFIYFHDTHSENFQKNIAKDLLIKFCTPQKR